MQNRIIDLSDVLVNAPPYFPDREILGALLGAAAKLVDPLRKDKAQQLRVAMTDVTEALGRLRTDTAALDSSDEREGEKKD